MAAFARRHVLPIVIAACAALVFIVLIIGELHALDRFANASISLVFRPWDVAIGLFIYFKTAIDFAFYMGRLMAHNRGEVSRIAIQSGTAAGNAIGTMAIIAVWALFKEVTWLLVAMIVIAALILFQLAGEGFEQAEEKYAQFPAWFRKLVRFFDHILRAVNRVTDIVLGKLIPSIKIREASGLPPRELLTHAFTVPFFLGLDDFAGYIALFSVVNIYGFAIGVVTGQFLLTVALYLSPQTTTRVVTHPLVLFAGSLAFVGIGAWGIFEATALALG